MLCLHYIRDYPERRTLMTDLLINFFSSIQNWFASLGFIGQFQESVDEFFNAFYKTIQQYWWYGI